MEKISKFVKNSDLLDTVIFKIIQIEITEKLLKNRVFQFFACNFFVFKDKNLKFTGFVVQVRAPIFQVKEK